MRSKHPSPKKTAEQVVKDIRQSMRRHFSAEGKIRSVLEGLRGEGTIAELRCKEGIAQSLSYTWSTEFLESGKRRLAGVTVRTATTDEGKDFFESKCWGKSASLILNPVTLFWPSTNSYV